MLLLISGLILWSAVHLIPSVAVGFRASVINKLGLNRYSAIFSLFIIAALVLIVFGWKAAVPEALYAFPVFVRHISMLLVVVALILFGASVYPTRIQSYIRHPQLSGVLLWSVAHLLMNGDTRSVTLFGGLALWAIVEMFLINRRDGEWEKKEPPSWKVETVGGLVTLVVIAIVVLVHPYIAGVPVY